MNRYDKFKHFASMIFIKVSNIIFKVFITIFITTKQSEENALLIDK